MLHLQMRNYNNILTIPEFNHFTFNISFQIWRFKYLFKLEVCCNKNTNFVIEKVIIKKQRIIYVIKYSIPYNI